MKTEKKKITEVISELRKCGFTVINNNYNKGFGKQMAGFVDYVIYNFNYIHFVEVKIGYDKLSEAQKDTKAKLESIAKQSAHIYYHIITSEAGAKSMVDFIASKK